MKSYVLDITFVVGADSEKKAREAFKNVSRYDIEEMADHALIKDVIIIKQWKGGV